jgi:hypothetical protein
MRTKSNCWVWFLLLDSIFAIFAATTASFGAENPAGGIPSVQELPAACRAAKERFRPLTKDDVARAKTALVQALERLDLRLKEAGPNGDDWRKYLKWNELQAELQRSEEVNIAAVTAAYKRFTADVDGLDLVWFLDVQQALGNFVKTANAVDNPQIKTAYEQMLDTLASRLDAFAAKPTAEGAMAIADSVRWLEEAQQVPDLVKAIRHNYVQPNLIAEVSAAIVGAGIVGPVDDTMPVRDCILGTTLFGTAHTVGQTTVELSPSSRSAVIDTLLSGSSDSATIGYHGPVTVHSSAKTTFDARKRLSLDATGFSASPATSHAATSSQIQSIQTDKRLGKRIIENAAWNRAGKQKGQAEAIASQHAEQRLDKRINDQAGETLAKANQSYNDKFRRPFTERKLFPQQLDFSTTEKVLRVVGLQAGNSRLAAPVAAPPVVEGADMSVCVHESMVNNLAADALAGRTVHEEKLQSLAIEMLGHLPDRMKGDDDGLPWAITFARRQPISVVFADDGFQVTIRGAKYIKGQDAHPGMDVSASYKIEKSAEGFKAVRQGSIQVFPPDFVPGSGEKVDAHRQIIRTLLEKRFAKVFELELIGEGLVLPGKWESAGKLIPIQVTSQNGWLVIAWKRSPAASSETKLAEARETADIAGK